MSALIPLDQIRDNPYQGRADYGDIEPLAVSIATEDLQETPKARKNGKGYELKFGHRRAEAFRWLYHNWKAKGLPDRYEGYSKMPLDVQELTDEEMYRGAVIENELRKDLNDIERARMMKFYREEFSKTSAEVGVVFGVNDATVRSMTRLLDLHPDAQKLLAEGKITQGTARTLLSAQKIVDAADAIKAVVKKLASVPNTNDHEAIVERAIERGGNVIEMWGRWDSNSKPRAGRDLWLLDMKNFPNKMLPLLSPADTQACVGNRIAEAVNYLNGLTSAPLPDELKARLDHLVNPPACNACPFYAVVNKTHYCGVKICHRRKEAAFTAQKLADMSRTLKIAVYQENDGAYLLLDEDIASHKKAFEARNADLRLLPASALRGYSYQHFKGADSSTAKVVAVGESTNTLAVRGAKSKGGKKTEKEKAEMRAMRLYRTRRLELTWEYTAAAQGIFEGAPMEALRKLRGWNYVGVDNCIPEDHNRPSTGSDAERLAFARRDLTWALIVEQSSHYTRSKLTDILERFTKITGVKAPKPLVKRAEEWDAEIHALASVSAETKGKKK